MTSNSPETSILAAVHLPPAVETPRRSMLVHVTTAVLGLLIIAVPSTLSGLFFLDPILRKRKAASGGADNGEVPKKDEAGFIRLDVTKDSVPQDGTPLSVTVNDDLVDAWNLFRDVPVGSIWLRKVGDGPILAFNSVCPHLGCSVDYIRADNHFFCPCHTSAFALDGKKTNEIPPRDMDALDVSMRTNGLEDANGLEIWVKFQNFQKATSDKIVI
ncbi:MAG: Rieske 2Fe-2S domain-containing protein [Planctomycetaceae bacterium]